MKKTKKIIFNFTTIFFTLLSVLVVLIFINEKMYIITPFNTNREYYGVISHYGNRPVLNPSRDDLISTLDKYKKQGGKTIDIIPSFNDFNNTCQSSQSCIQIDNSQSNQWYSIYNKMPTLDQISGPFVVKITMGTDATLSGVIFYGRTHPDGTNWWTDTSQFFIGTDSSNRRLFANVNNGASENDVQILEQHYDYPIKSFYVVFDKEGKNYIVADEFYNILVYQDINKVSNNRFPQGIFLDNRLKFGYTTSPFSHFSLFELSVTTL